MAKKDFRVSLERMPLGCWAEWLDIRAARRRGIKFFFFGGGLEGGVGMLTDKCVGCVGDGEACEGGEEEVGVC